MSSTVFPITLTVVDSNGNTVGTTQITQDIADTLYSYYISKLNSDTQEQVNLVNAIINNADAFDALYNAIKNKLLSDECFLLSVRYGNAVNCVNAPKPVEVPVPVVAQPTFNTLGLQLTRMFSQMIPILMMTQIVEALKPRNSFTEIFEALVPLLVVVPLFGKLLEE